MAKTVTANLITVKPQAFLSVRHAYFVEVGKHNIRLFIL